MPTDNVKFLSGCFFAFITFFALFVIILLQDQYPSLCSRASYSLISMLFALGAALSGGLIGGSGYLSGDIQPIDPRNIVRVSMRFAIYGAVASMGIVLAILFYVKPTADCIPVRIGINEAVIGLKGIREAINVANAPTAGLHEKSKGIINSVRNGERPVSDLVAVDSNLENIRTGYEIIARQLQEIDSNLDKISGKFPDNKK